MLEYYFVTKEIEQSLRRDNTHYFVYPEYLDKSLKRSEGRRLPLDCSLDNPTWQEIRLAAEKLGLGCEIRKEGGYSRQWWNPKGLLLVEKKKIEIINFAGNKRRNRKEYSTCIGEKEKRVNRREKETQDNDCKNKKGEKDRCRFSAETT